ncbi:MAG: hypothetical protein QG623_166 [Patescibacteria group bacterium]|nr:hypothetical protein [Patescibacteria group bacterium]
MGDLSLGRFSNERTWSRGARSLSTEGTTTQRDPQFDPFAGISVYARPVIAGLASVGMGAMALSSKDNINRLVLGAGAAIAGAISIRVILDTTN